MGFTTFFFPVLYVKFKKLHQRRPYKLEIRLLNEEYSEVYQIFYNREISQLTLVYIYIYFFQYEEREEHRNTIIASTYRFFFESLNHYHCIGNTSPWCPE